MTLETLTRSVRLFFFACQISYRKLPNNIFVHSPLSPLYTTLKSHPCPLILHNRFGIYVRDSTPPFKLLIILSLYHLTPIGEHLNRQFATVLSVPRVPYKFICDRYIVRGVLIRYNYFDSFVPETFGNRLVSVRKIVQVTRRIGQCVSRMVFANFFWTPVVFEDPGRRT